MPAQGLQAKANAQNLAYEAKEAGEIASLISQLDKNNDGQVDPMEIYHAVCDFAEKDASKEQATKILKFTALMFAFLLTVSLLINCCCMYIMVNTFTKVTVTNGAMISRETGAPVMADPAGFSVARHAVPTGSVPNDFEPEAQVSLSQPMLPPDGALQGSPISSPVCAVAAAHK